MKPKNRVFCYECGRAKMLFQDEKKALNFIKFNSNSFDDKFPIRSYYCEVCCGWHVTSKKGSSYRNDFTEKIINSFKNTNNKKQKIQSIYSAEILNKFNTLKSQCFGIIKSKQDRIKNAHQKLIDIEEQKLQLSSYLVPTDLETLETLVKETKSFINNYLNKPL